ncbi:MAG: response regulator [Acidobacteria bacterium]|nr:response regulator [Acidobacteriota bacterium]
MLSNPVRRLVLVAEDDTAVRELLCLLLTSEGFEVLSAADGRRAFELFLRFSDEVAFVVTDLNMPYMDGLQLATAVGQVRANVPVLVVTGSGDLAGLRTSGRPYLTKPIAIADLLAQVTVAIRPAATAAREASQ